MLTPTQALVLQTVTWWIRGARQKGKNHTSATAAQVSKWIGDKFYADVSPKSAQNSLRYLVDVGYLRRETHRQSGYSTVYRYFLTGEIAVQVTVPDCHSAEPEKPPLIVNKEKENQIKRVAHVPEPQAARDPAPFSYRSSGLQTNVEWASGARSLSQISELCRKIGSEELPNPSEDAEGYTNSLRETER